MNKKTIKALLNKEWKEETGKTGKLEKLWGRRGGKTERKMSGERAPGPVKKGGKNVASKNSSKPKVAAVIIRERRMKEARDGRRNKSKDSQFDKSMRVLEWLDADCGTKLTRHYEEGGGWRYKDDDDDVDEDVGYDDDRGGGDDRNVRRRPILRHPLRLTVSSNMLDSDSSWEMNDGSGQRDSEEEEEERSEDSFFDDEEEDDDDAVLAIRKWQEKEQQQQHCLEEISLQEYVTSSEDDDNDYDNNDIVKRNVRVDANLNNSVSCASDDNEEDELVAALKEWQDEQKLLQLQQQQQDLQNKDHPQQQQQLSPVLEGRGSIGQDSIVFPFLEHRQFYRDHQTHTQTQKAPTPAPFWWVEDVGSVREGPSSPPVIVRAKNHANILCDVSTSTSSTTSTTATTKTTTTPTTKEHVGSLRFKSPAVSANNVSPSQAAGALSLLCPYAHNVAGRSPSFVSLTPTSSPSAKSPRLEAHAKVNKTLSCPASRGPEVTPGPLSARMGASTNPVIFGFTESFVASGGNTSPSYVTNVEGGIRSPCAREQNYDNSLTTPKGTSVGHSIKSPDMQVSQFHYSSTLQINTSGKNQGYFSSCQNITPKPYTSDILSPQSLHSPAIRISSSSECLPSGDPRDTAVMTSGNKSSRSGTQTPYSSGARTITRNNSSERQESDKNTIASPTTKLPGLTKIGGFFRRVGEKFSSSQNLHEDNSSSALLSPHAKIKKQNSSPPLLMLQQQQQHQQNQLQQQQQQQQQQPQHHHYQQQFEQLHKPLLSSTKHHHHRTLQPVKSSPPLSSSTDEHPRFLLPLTPAQTSLSVHTVNAAVAAADLSSSLSPHHYHHPHPHSSQQHPLTNKAPSPSPSPIESYFKLAALSPRHHNTGPTTHNEGTITPASRTVAVGGGGDLSSSGSGIVLKSADASSSSVSSNINNKSDSGGTGTYRNNNSGSNSSTNQDGVLTIPVATGTAFGGSGSGSIKRDTNTNTRTGDFDQRGVGSDIVGLTAGATAVAVNRATASPCLDTIQAKWKAVIHTEKKRHASCNETTNRVSVIKEQLSFSHSAPPAGHVLSEQQLQQHHQQRQHQQQQLQHHQQRLQQQQQQQQQQYHQQPQQHGLSNSSILKKTTNESIYNKNKNELLKTVSGNATYQNSSTLNNNNAMRKSNENLEERSRDKFIPIGSIRSQQKGNVAASSGGFVTGSGLRKSPNFDLEKKIHSDSVEHDPQGKARGFMTSSTGSFDGCDSGGGTGDNVFVKHVSYFKKKVGSTEKGGSLSSERSSSTSSDERGNLAVPQQGFEPNNRRGSQGTCNHLFRDQPTPGRKSPLPKGKKSPSPVRAALFRNIANTCPTYSSSLDSATSKQQQQMYSKSLKPTSSPTKQIHSQPSIPSAFHQSSFQTSPQHHLYQPKQQQQTSPQHSNTSPLKMISPDISPPIAYKGRRKFSDTGLTPVPKRLLKDAHPRRGSLTDERTLVSAKSKLTRLRWQGRKASADSGSVAALVKQIHNLWGDGEDECNFNPPSSCTVDDQVLFDKRRKKFPFSMNREKDGITGSGNNGSSGDCDRKVRNRISGGNHSGSDSSLVIGNNSSSSGHGGGGLKASHSNKNDDSSNALSAPSLPLLSTLSSSNLLSSHGQITTIGETNWHQDGRFNYEKSGDGSKRETQGMTRDKDGSCGAGGERSVGGGSGGGGSTGHYTSGDSRVNNSVGSGSGVTGSSNILLSPSAFSSSSSSSTNCCHNMSSAGKNSKSSSSSSSCGGTCIHCNNEVVNSGGGNACGSSDSKSGGSNLISEFVAPVAQAASRQLVATAVVGAADLVGRDHCDALLGKGSSVNNQRNNTSSIAFPCTSCGSNCGGGGGGGVPSNNDTSRCNHQQHHHPVIGQTRSITGGIITTTSSLSSSERTSKRAATVQFQSIVSWDDHSVGEKYSPAKRSVLKQGARRHSSFAGFSDSCDSIASTVDVKNQHGGNAITSSSAILTKAINKSIIPKSKTSDNYKSILKQTDKSPLSNIDTHGNTSIANSSISVADKKRAKSPSPKSKKGFDYGGDGSNSGSGGGGKNSSDISTLSLCLKATRSLSPKSKKCKTDNSSSTNSVSCSCNFNLDTLTTDLSTDRDLQTDSGNCSFDLPTKTVGVQATPRTIGKTSNTGTQTADAQVGTTPDSDPSTSSIEGGGWLQRLAAKCMASVGGNKSSNSSGTGGSSGGSGGACSGTGGGSSGLPRAASVRAEWLLGNKRMGSNPSSPVATSGDTSEKFWVPQGVLARKRAQSLIPTVSKQESEEDLSSENATPAFIPNPRELAFTFPTEKTSASGSNISGCEGQPATPPSGYNPGRRRASMHDAIDLNKIDTRLYDKKLVRQASVTSIEEETQGTVHICLEHNTETSILTVNLVRAHNLSPRDINGTANPYCKLTLLPEQRISAQSRIHRKTLNPEFEEEFIFELTCEQADNSSLDVLFYEYDQFSKDECVGHVIIPLKTLDLRKPLDLWRPIQPYEKPKDQRDHGDVMFSLGYLPSAERLTVVIVKARNLRLQEDTKAELNPFIKVCILSGNKKLKKKKTSTAHACNSPTWNEALVFNVHKDNLKTLGLEVSAYHENKLVIDECIGRVRLPVQSVKGGRTQELLTEKSSQPGWYTLT